MPKISLNRTKLPLTQPPVVMSRPPTKENASKPKFCSNLNRQDALNNAHSIRSKSFKRQSITTGDHGKQGCSTQTICNVNGCTTNVCYITHQKMSTNIDQKCCSELSRLFLVQNTVQLKRSHFQITEVLYRFWRMKLPINCKGIREPLCLNWTSDTYRLENKSRKMSISISSSSNRKKAYTINNVHIVKILNLLSQTLAADVIREKYPLACTTATQGYPLNSEKINSMMLLKRDLVGQSMTLVESIVKPL